MKEKNLKMQWDYYEIIQLVLILVRNTASAERESHYHEVWSELLTFLCKAYKKELSRISCIPQIEIGYQPTGPADEQGELPPGPSTRRSAKSQRGEVGEAELVGLQDTSMDAPTLSAASTANSEPREVPDGRRRSEPETMWQRPDWLVIGRIFSRSGKIPGQMASVVLAEYPILLLELKQDEYNERMGDLKAGEEPDVAHVNKAVISAIPQVLQQAQFVFAEFKDAADTIHAIVAIGTICEDFSIRKSDLPPLSEALLNDPAVPVTETRLADLAKMYAHDRSEPYHILNKEKTGLHPRFLEAWGKARNVHATFKRYQSD